MSTTSRNTSSNSHRQALRLPTALNSSDSDTSVSPGWEDIPKSLPTLGEEDERSFLQIMFAELNAKFTLQLDTCPITDGSCKAATDNPDEDRLGIVLAGSSHAARLIDHLESANLWVVDSMVPGFRVMEQSVSEISADLAEKVSDLDSMKNVVLVQLDGKYHVEGELCVIGKETLSKHFPTLPASL